MAEQLPQEKSETGPSFGALSAAVSPAWHRAIIRLAKATENLQRRFDAWGAAHMGADGSFVQETRQLVAELIEFLGLAIDRSHREPRRQRRKID